MVRDYYLILNLYITQPLMISFICICLKYQVVYKHLLVLILYNFNSSSNNEKII